MVKNCIPFICHHWFISWLVGSQCSPNIECNFLYQVHTHTHVFVKNSCVRGLAHPKSVKRNGHKELNKDIFGSDWVSFHIVCTVNYARDQIIKTNGSDFIHWCICYRMFVKKIVTVCQWEYLIRVREQERKNLFVKHFRVHVQEESD